MSDNIFKAAAIMKLRFPTSRGEVALEALYDMPLTSKTNNRFDLNSVAKAINAELKEQTEEDFVDTKYNASADRLRVALEVVKEVIKDKQDTAKAASDALAKKHEREKLLEILAKKTDEQLGNLSVEELQQRIAAL